jgi:hypothetical protein
MMANNMNEAPRMTSMAEDASANGMPGWSIERPQRMEDDADAGGIPAATTHSSPSLEALCEKYLGAAPAMAEDDAGIASSVAEEPTVDVVRVRPNAGGPAKVADLVNGQLTVMQG